MKPGRGPRRWQRRWRTCGTRRYPAAADLAEAIALEGDKASPLGVDLSTLRRVEKRDLAFDRPAHDPGELARRFVVSAICNGSGERNPARMFVDGTSEEDVSSVCGAFVGFGIP